MDMRDVNVNTEIPTSKQLSFIKDIEEFVGVPFTGTTRSEASAYISIHIDEYKLLTMDNWSLEHGYF